MILSVRGLTLETRAGIRLVEDLSLDLEKGKIRALVGESGCGKSLTALAILGLPPTGVRQTAGEIYLGGERIDDLPPAERRGLLGKRISMIFQEPVAALNPVMKIGDQVGEVLRIHRGLSKAEARAEAEKWLAHVKIPDAPKRLHQYPHQLSGGLCQRVVIAMALIGGPEVVLADEPTTALDVTVQAQILELIRDLARETGPAFLLITHDMGVVAETADTITVMYAGEPVEEGRAGDCLRAPAHPYTEALLAALPRLGEEGPLRTIPGLVPRPGGWPSGCRFAPRCARRFDPCDKAPVPMSERGENRRARCLLEKLSEKLA